jgi:glycosyltransferase involved in cell wall biosynthesis
LGNGALFLCTSELERREVLAAGIVPERVVVRPNGLDLREFEPLPPRGAFRRESHIPPGDRYVLFLSRLIPRKGADLLIDAFADVCPGGWLVIAGPEGEPGYLQFLKRRAAARGVAGRVLFPGSLMNERKLAALVDCDIFVLPSRYENFANVIVEAVACGRPVIVTDRCGVSEFVAGRAGVVIPYERSALAAALRSVFSDAVLYSRLESEAPALAPEFDWARILPQVESWFEQVIKEHSPAARVVDS